MSGHQTGLCVSRASAKQPDCLEGTSNLLEIPRNKLGGGELVGLQAVADIQPAEAPGGHLFEFEGLVVLEVPGALAVWVAAGQRAATTGSQRSPWKASGAGGFLVHCEFLSKWPPFIALFLN